MRLALIFLWVAIAAALLLPVLRRLAVPPRPAQRALPDELVKDPVCQTYVVKSRAVTRVTHGEVSYFCSAECARRAAGG